ncbi:MAG: hypothetical protein ACREFX_09120 [Opitutaceae bacterium]
MKFRQSSSNVAGGQGAKTCGDGPSGPSRTRASGIRWLLRGVFAAALAIAAAFAFSRRIPAPSYPFRLTAVFDAGKPGRSDPLVVSGAPGDADFLYVRFVTPETAVFGYDSWGFGGPVSAPVRIAPGIPHRLVIEAPMMTGTIPGFAGARTARLRVTFDGAVVLRAGKVQAHAREPQDFFVGWNPDGGTSCGARFHGRLERPDGKPVRGPSRVAAGLPRIVDVWTASVVRFWLVLLGIALLALLCDRTLAWAVRDRGRVEGGAWARHRWFFAAALVCGAAFAYFVTEGTGSLFYPESFGDFYDYQAAGLLHGRLDVPRGAISVEAFLVRGKAYGYFGPTPALMRIPFVLGGWEFGRLSRAFMLAEFLGCLGFAYLILRRAARLVRGPNAEPGPAAVLVLCANTGLGSTLLFLGSRAYIYHEAILCGAAFALASGYFALEYLSAPTGRRWLAAWICGLLSINARPSVGLFALGFLAVVTFEGLVRRRPRPPALRRLALCGLCAAGVLSVNAVSYLKFRTFDSMPLKYNVQYGPARLARIGEAKFHLSNAPCDLDGYLWGVHFRIDSHFPFLTAGRPAIADYPRAKMDLIEPIVGIPYAMTGLFLLALGSLYAAVKISSLRRPILLGWIAVIPLALGLFTAMAMSHRYTADFVPFLVLVSTFALAAFETHLLGSGVRTALALATVWSIFATSALTFRAQGQLIWGEPPEAAARYRDLKARVDGWLEPGRARHPERHPQKTGL